MYSTYRESYKSKPDSLEFVLANYLLKQPTTVLFDVSGTDKCEIEDVTLKDIVSSSALDISSCCLINIALFPDGKNLPCGSHPVRLEQPAN